MSNFERWNQRAELLVFGSADPFVTWRGTVRASVGNLVSIGAIFVVCNLIFAGPVDRHVWVFPVTYSVVFPLYMRWRWLRQQRRGD